MFPTRSTFPLAAALMAALALTGCGQPAATGVLPTSRGGIVMVRSAAAVAPKSSMEQAFAAMQAAVLKAGGRGVGLVSASGYGIGRDGRLLTDAEMDALAPGAREAHGSSHWYFRFQKPGGLLKGRAKEFWVTVSADGGLTVEEHAQMREERPWTLAPEKLVPLAKAFALAKADGLAGEHFDVQIGHGNAMIFGGQKEPYIGPLTYMISRTGKFYDEHRLVSAASGLLHHHPDAAELEQSRQLITPVVTRWHREMTQGADRPATREDVMRLGIAADAADFFIETHDHDGDRRVSLAELVGDYTTTKWLQGWRELTIKRQFYMADVDHSEDLSPAEAARVKYEAFSYQRQIKLLPMPIDAAAFAAADRDGNGGLDINEYAPVGMAASLRLVELNPEAANAFFFHVQTKPWSH